MTVTDLTITISARARPPQEREIYSYLRAVERGEGDDLPEWRSTFSLAELKLLETEKWRDHPFIPACQVTMLWESSDFVYRIGERLFRWCRDGEPFAGAC